MLALFLAAALSAAASPAPGSPPSVSLRRGADAPGPVQAWFSALDRVLSKSFQTTLLLAQTVDKPTWSAVQPALSEVESAAADYEEVTKDSSAREALAALKAKLMETARGLPGDATLPSRALELLFSLKSESVNRWAQLMRQEALGSPGPSGSFPANALLTTERAGAPALELPILDVRPSQTAEVDRVGVGLWGLATALRDMGQPPLGSIVLGRNRLWMRLEGAQLYADLSLPESGGMLRLRYQEPGAGVLDQARFYFLTRALYELGFAAGVDNGELVASLESGGLEPERMVERLSMALKALALSARMKPALENYLRGSLSANENALRLDELARIFAAEGDLPFLRGTAPENLSRGVLAWRDAGPEREALRGEMNRTLAWLRLKPFPEGEAVGRRTADLYYKTPIEAGLARGELRLSHGRPERVKNYDGLAALAGTPASSGSAYEARLSPLLDGMDVIGQVGPWLAQRGQWRLDPRRWIILYILRGQDGRIGAARAELGVVDGTPRPLEVKSALAELESAGLIRSEPSLQRATWPWPARALYRGSGLPLTARVTYDKSQALLGQSLYITPYVVPSDETLLRHAAGLITTSGGPQATMLAALAGKPALNIGPAEWTQGSGIRLAQPLFSPARRVRGVKVRDVVGIRWLTLREGAALRIDPARQQVEFLDEGRQAVFMRVEEAIKAYDRGADINALALWVMGQLKTQDFSRAEKQELAAELVSELQKRRKTGIPAAHLDRIRSVIRDNL